MACFLAQLHQNYNSNIEQPSLEPSEIELSGSLTIKELKKPHPSRLVGGVKVWNSLVPHPCVVDKNSGGISQEQEVPAPHQAPSPGYQCQEDKSPQLLAAKTTED